MADRFGVLAWSETVRTEKVRVSHGCGMRLRGKRDAEMMGAIGSEGGELRKQERTKRKCGRRDLPSCDSLTNDITKDLDECLSRDLSLLGQILDFDKRCVGINLVLLLLL